MQSLWFVIGFVVTTVAVITTETLVNNFKKSK